MSSVGIRLTLGILTLLLREPLASKRFARDGMPVRPADKSGKVLYDIQLDTQLGTGDARFVVKFAARDDRAHSVVVVRGTEGASMKVPADGREHSIRVPSSIPHATTVVVDATSVLVVIKKGEPVYFLRDECATWAIVSSVTDARMGKKPGVVCQPVDSPCPEDYVVSNDPPLFRDERCPSPQTTNSGTAKLCYRPGTVRFQSASRTTVSLIDKLSPGSPVLKRFQLVPGVPSEDLRIEYERCRPVAVDIGGRKYFLAVGHGDGWLVSIESDGKPTVDVR
jgi:hypothetical protein